MLTNIALFVLGLFLLVKGSNHFVKSAASIARKLGISEFIIGLTLVAFGTSIPELASSVVASLRQESGIVVGNIVGSNMANIGLIIGLIAFIYAMKTTQDLLKRDGYIMIFAAVLFYLVIFSGRIISRLEASLFILIYIAYILFLFEKKPAFKGRYHFKEFVLYFFKFQYITKLKNEIASVTNKKESIKEKKSKSSKEGILKDIVILVVSGAAIVIGANYHIEKIIYFAELFNIPKNLIAITVVAIGTSLPELSVSLAAARKGYSDIALGNIIGSNITNILLILGASALVYPLAITESTLFISAPAMILLSALLLIFIKSDWEIRRREGLLFLIVYSLCITLLFLINI